MQPIPPLPSLEELVQQLGDLAGMPAVITACACAVLVVVLRDWRGLLAAFMAMQLALAVLTSLFLPPVWSLLNVIVGGLMAIMWYLSAQRAGWGGRFLPFRSTSGVQSRPLSSTTLFRAVAALTLAGALLAARPRLPLPPTPPDVRVVATWLAAYSLLGLALGDEALQAGAALGIWLAATQLVVGALNPDPWLIGLLAAVNLLIGLGTAYLMVARGPAMSQSPGEEGE